MSCKRSAVQPSESENVARKSKKGKILNQGLYQTSTMSELYNGQKKITAGTLQWHLQKLSGWASNKVKKMHKI
jgi:hypothetical protein